MDSICYRDLLARIRTIPELENSCGMTVGGRADDPGMTNVPLPAAWIMHARDDVIEDPKGADDSGSALVPVVESVQYSTSVLIYVPYTTEAELLDLWFPLLNSVKRAIHAKPAPNGSRWRYMGQKLAIVHPKRLAYEQHYSLTVLT